MKKILEKMDQFAGQAVGQKPGDQVRGTEKAKPRKDGKHPFAGRLVGANESIIKELDKTAKETATERKLAEEFANFQDVSETAHQYHVVSKLDGAVLASYKTKEDAHKNSHGNPVVSGSLETIGDRQYVREQDVAEGVVGRAIAKGKDMLDRLDGNPNPSNLINQKRKEKQDQRKKQSRQPQQDVAEGEGKVDTVKMDVPLMIRMLEYAREDAQTDMDLHDVAERMIKLGQGDRTLTMDDYDKICIGQEQGVAEEQEAKYGDKYQAAVKRVGQKAREQEKRKPVDIQALAAKLAAMDKQVKQLKEVNTVAPTAPTTAGGAPATQQNQADQDVVNTQKNLSKLKAVNPQLNPGLANQALQNISDNPQAPVAGAQMAQTKNLADLVGDALADPQKGPQVATMLSQVQPAQKLKK